ncbi:MAG TPA: hypothetical protein VMF69_00120 [Gemmataceae bacterium]|nr:hypothetical protein [Gemmataceae bacterium]
MRHPHALAPLLLLLSGLSSAAEDVPERLLPATTQIYLRWDGVDAHQAAYGKTSLGRMMKGDTGAFIAGVFDKLQNSSAALLTVETLRRGLEPKALKKMQADAKAAAKLFGQLGRTGFILAGQLRQLDRPQGDLFLILPGMGEGPDPFFGALRLAIGLSEGEIKEQKIAGRSVASLELPPINLAWWVEGKDAVFVLSTDNPEAIVKKMVSQDRAPLTDQALFQRVASFKKFETDARALVDVSALVKMGAKRGKEMSKLLDDLGAMDLRSLTLYSGFEGRAERGLIEWDMPGPRKGLLKLLSGKRFQLSDVPPLPPDVVNWSMSNFDIAVLYDTLYKAAEQIVGLISPEDLPKIKELTKQVNDFLGVDLRKDLLGSLGERFASYTSPGDGPLFFGQTLLFQVKDAEKLGATLEQIIKNLGAASGKEVRIKKRDYRGAVIREVYVQEKGFIFVPTYTIHKDWLVLGWYPQSVQAFVQRSKGELASWKPSEQTKSLMSKLPSEFVSITYSDPRPSVKQLMSIAPIIAGAVGSFNPSLNFEVGSLPATQEVTKHLFPNLAVTSDDGKTLRQDSLDSLALPLDLAGLDAYSLFFIVSVFGRFAF